VTFAVWKMDYGSWNIAARTDPPKNRVIALWPNTPVVKCKYYVSQKQKGFNGKIHWYSMFSAKIHWYSILLTFVFKFTARL